MHQAKAFCPFHPFYADYICIADSYYLLPDIWYNFRQSQRDEDGITTNHISLVSCMAARFGMNRLYLGIWAGLNETWPNGDYTTATKRRIKFDSWPFPYPSILLAKKKVQQEVKPGNTGRSLTTRCCLEMAHSTDNAADYRRSFHFTLIGWVWVVYIYLVFLLPPSRKLPILIFTPAGISVYSVFLAVPSKSGQEKVFKPDRAVAFEQTIRTAWWITRRYSPYDLLHRRKILKYPYTGFTTYITVTGIGGPHPFFTRRKQEDDNSVGFRQSFDSVCWLSPHRHCVGKPNQTSGLEWCYKKPAGFIRLPLGSLVSDMSTMASPRNQYRRVRDDVREREKTKQKKVAHKYSCGGGIMCCRLSRNVAAHHPPSRHLNISSNARGLLPYIHMHVSTARYKYTYERMLECAPEMD